MRPRTLLALLLLGGGAFVFVAAATTPPPAVCGGLSAGGGPPATLTAAAVRLLNASQAQFAAELAGKTGLDGSVVAAWVVAEEGGQSAAPNGTNNWLNIGATDSGFYGGSNSFWDSPVSAADFSAEWLRGTPEPGFGAASSGIRAILSTVGQPAAVQIAAIQQSGWAKSGYPDLPTLYTEVSGGAPTSVPVSYTTPCAASSPVGSGSDPIPEFTPSRDDMGVDACATPGMPIYAPAASTLVQVIDASNTPGGWYQGEPLLLFQFTPPLPGAQSDYWYVAEQITPVTETAGTTFAAHQEVATFASHGTCIEIGWGSPTSVQRTLAGQQRDAAAANPPAGALTPWGETFKQYFGIPWVGQSP
ncbi:MAG: hypothetical protein ABSG43_03440 [Solirubrobacteraceae bacterium]